MIECAHCGTQNRKASKYCSNCGRCLDVVPDTACRVCSRLSSPGSAFCQFCGAALAAAGPLRETGAAVPEVAAASEEAELRQSAGQGASKGPARRVPSWLYGAKSGAEAAPVPGVEPGHAQPKHKYLEGIGDVLATADAWLPPGNK